MDRIARRVGGVLYWCSIGPHPEVESEYAIGPPICRLTPQEIKELNEKDYPGYPCSDPDTYIDVMDLPGRVSYTEVDVLEDDYLEDSMP